MNSWTDIIILYLSINLLTDTLLSLPKYYAVSQHACMYRAQFVQNS